MQVVLEYKTEATNEPCGLCGQAAFGAAGMQFILAGNCRPGLPGLWPQACSRRWPPWFNLADAATRIGRIGRHSVFPPLTALLDLANAAEKYAAYRWPASRRQG